MSRMKDEIINVRIYVSRETNHPVTDARMRELKSNIAQATRDAGFVVHETTLEVQPDQGDQHELSQV